MSEVLLGRLTAEGLRPEATSLVSDCPPALSPPPPRPTVPGEGSSGPSATQLGERKEGFVARPSPAPSYPVTISGSKSPGCARGTSALCEGGRSRPASCRPGPVPRGHLGDPRATPLAPGTGQAAPCGICHSTAPFSGPLSALASSVQHPEPLAGGPIHTPRFLPAVRG